MANATARSSRRVFEFAFAIVIMITLSEQKESAPTTAESSAASAIPADMWIARMRPDARAELRSSVKTPPVAAVLRMRQPRTVGSSTLTAGEKGT